MKFLCRWLDEDIFSQAGDDEVDTESNSEELE